MINASEHITSPYDLRIPLDSFLLKHQPRLTPPPAARHDHAARSPGRREPEPADPDDAGTFTWFLRNCRRVCKASDALSPVALMNQVLPLLKQDDCEVLASLLCDALGVENVDFVAKLVTFRQHLTRQWEAMLAKLCTKIRYNRLDEANYERLNLAVLKKTGRELSKHKQRLEAVLSQIPPQDLFCLIGLDLKSERRLSSHVTFPRPVSLNLVKEDCDAYEKLTLPPLEHKIQARDEDLIPISDLPEWAQPAFAGIERLNLIQSKVFNSAFNTTQNLLVSAPTGCGKTNVGLLCVLNNYREFLEGGRRCGKVIYIAPMKALAAEIVDKYSRALGASGLVVREVTGDYQVARSELEEIDVIVTTPEKCDVVTRNSFSTATQSDDSFLTRVNLIIFDEIHLLNDERGPVIETIAARFFRLIESTQVSRRVVGISATLPNYEDIAAFLRVPPEHTYYFNREYRHVPLEQIFYGIKVDDHQKTNALAICFKHVVETLEKGKQCMVFVHSRNETLSTALRLIELVKAEGREDLFVPEIGSYKRFASFLNKQGTLRPLAEYSMSIHHAGLSKHDRDTVEDMFKAGLARLLVCTSTLAWGVNLPAHCVVIKGTFIGGVGADRHINNLELNQIMGRAGRPQFDSEGVGVLITEHKQLHAYVRMQTERVPIESQLHRHLENALNAEVAIGAVNSEAEAVAWLQYTYLYVRMGRNPLHYGLSGDDAESLLRYRAEIVKGAARNLHASRLVRHAPRTGELSSTELGRIAARYYVDYETTHNLAASVNPLLYYQGGALMDRSYNARHDLLTPAFVLERLCECREFECVLFRQDELEELLELAGSPLVAHPPRGGVHHVKHKVSVLVQAFIAGLRVRSSSLLTDMLFVAQNMPRLARAYFEISMCETVCGPPVRQIHDWVLVLERQIVYRNILSNFTSPIVHSGFASRLESAASRVESLGASNRVEGAVSRLEGADTPTPTSNTPANNNTPAKKPALLSLATVERFSKFSLEQILAFTHQEVLDVVRSRAEAAAVHRCLRCVPCPRVALFNQPVTARISRLTVALRLEHEWSRRWNGASESFHVWVCTSSRLLCQAQVHFTQRGLQSAEFYVPVHNRNEAFSVQVFSAGWLGLCFELPTRFDAASVSADAFTPLLRLNPLPTAALGALNVYRFGHFNPLQTQLFPAAFLSDASLVVAAPTGSGKTLVAELALLRLFERRPGLLAVYVAPLKALAHERYKDWCSKFPGRRIIQLTGDSSIFNTSSANTGSDAANPTPNPPDALDSFDIVITTPEKWDGISRHWRRRRLVSRVALLVFDELHLLGESRGATIESIVARQHAIDKSTKSKVRYVCLSTSLSNIHEIAEWMGIGHVYNFSPAVRPVRCNLFIDGFSIRAYCPRMNSMNKPCFDTILKHEQGANVLIFVSSRRQTRLTAQDLMGLLQFNNLSFRPEAEVSPFSFDDEWLNVFVPYGIGIHHAGLSTKDREQVQDLFLNNKLKVLIATSTLAWGVNLPSKIVIIKGTEFYDGRVKKYIDYSATDIIQMVGRAGRNIRDGEAYAYIFTESRKVGFYKAFMFTPFPTESFFLDKINDALNAEIATGSVSTRRNALEYLSLTFLYRRLKSNPRYYTQSPSQHDADDQLINELRPDQTIRLDSTTRMEDGMKLEQLCQVVVDNALAALVRLGCLALEVPQDELRLLEHALLRPTLGGLLAAQHYVGCATVHAFARADLAAPLGFFEILRTLAGAAEFALVPLRHNEDLYNVQLAQQCPRGISESEASDPNAKAFLLLQARMFSLRLPVFDYNNDTKSVLDQLPRIIQCLLDLFIVNRNFANVIQLLLIYKCLYFGLNPFKLELPFDVTYEMDATKSIQKDGKASSTSVKIAVKLRQIATTSEAHYLFLVNRRTRLVYGFKRVHRESSHVFKLRLDARTDLDLILVLSCPTLMLHDQLLEVPVRFGK